MADDATDVQGSEITLDEFNADETTAKAEPSTAKIEAKAEVKESKAEDTKEEVKADDTAAPPDVATKTDTEDKANDAEVDETVEDKPSDKPLAPKSENRFQKLANENRELKDEVERLTSETYAPQSVSELSQVVNPETGEPYTIAEATDIALNQQMQMRDYNTRITNAQTLLGVEAYEVMQELPIFNPDSDKYDEELASIASETMEANLIRDPNIPEVGPDGKPTGLGIIVDYRQSPKQIYNTLARASGVSETKGQLKGQKAAQTMAANADEVGSVAPAKKQEDPLMALWTSDD